MLVDSGVHNNFHFDDCRRMAAIASICVQPEVYFSNPGITSVMSWAVGCLTRENTQECQAVFAQCRAVFVDFFHF